MSQNESMNGRIDDRFIPSLTAGKWKISICQSLNEKTPDELSDRKLLNEKISVEKEFTVGLPHFTADNTVLSCYPPHGTSGDYSRQLPHIVLKDASLPWARTLPLPSTLKEKVNAPWLALLVLKDSEILESDNKKASELLSRTDSIHLPTGSISAKELDTVCSYIRISKETAAEVLPSYEELSLLCHCRATDAENNPDVGQNKDGMTASILASRFPAASEPNVTVHLVSLEGLEQYLGVCEPQKTSKFDKSVLLISLYHWSFETTAATSLSFSRLLSNCTQNNKGTDLRLRYPLQEDDQKAFAENDETKEILARLQQGYVPMQYHVRTGEQSFAWYRGPLSPIKTHKWRPSEPFFSADSAMIYDENRGVFDLSLAAAWEAGRMASLADKTFSQKLLEIREAAQNLSDRLRNQISSNYFRETLPSQTDPDINAAELFQNLINDKLFQELANQNKIVQQQPYLEQNKDFQNPAGEIKKYMEEKEIKEQLYQAISPLLPPVCDWLARLFLLGKVPFDYLLPNMELLPEESIRFFYLDETWISALMDGALSVGLDSSRQTKFSILTKEMIFENSMKALSILRRSQYKDTQPEDAWKPDAISGFLIRSKLTRYWPNIEMHAHDNDKPLCILRFEHLAGDLLFCMLDGIPNKIEFLEPADGFGYGYSSEDTLTIQGINPKDSKTYRKQIGNIDNSRIVITPYLNQNRKLNVWKIANELDKRLQASVKLTKSSGAMALQLELKRTAIIFESPRRN